MDIEQIDGKGGVVTITEAHWSRYPQLAKVFRPVAEKKATTVADKKAVVADEPPTGDNEQEN